MLGRVSQGRFTCKTNHGVLQPNRWHEFEMATFIIRGVAWVSWSRMKKKAATLRCRLVDGVPLWHAA